MPEPIDPKVIAEREAVIRHLQDKLDEFLAIDDDPERCATDRSQASLLANHFQIAVDDIRAGRHLEERGT